VRVSELSRRSGVSVPTIKFYLREGLLPPGRSVSVTQSEYGEEHLRRLRLIRSLISVVGLSVAQTRQVLTAVDVQSNSLETLGIVHHALPAPTNLGKDDTDAHSAARAAELVEGMGWQVAEESPHREHLARGLAALRRVGLDGTPDQLFAYAELAEQTARLDFEFLNDFDEPMDLAERAAVGNLLTEGVLTTLRPRGPAARPGAGGGVKKKRAPHKGGCWVGGCVGLK
jgi:DNA-binding transcriptional MerR regulator